MGLQTKLVVFLRGQDSQLAFKTLGAVPDNAGMCYWIGDEEESIKQGEAG